MDAYPQFPTFATFTTFNDTFSQSSDVNRPVWPKEKPSGNELKRRSSVNIVTERLEKRTKNKKSCFELFITENVLKTIVEFINKTMEKTRIKSELALDYRTMDTNIDKIR